jgi:uncharacterized membrane protein YqjE
MDKSAAQGAPGLIASMSGLARNTVGLVLSRLELAALELSEVRNHVLQLLLVFSLAVIATLFALAYGTVMVVLLSWETLGWKILLIMTLGFFALAVGLVLYGRALLKQDKLALPATMGELKADRDMLL